MKRIHHIWLQDCSGSMNIGGAINGINEGLHAALSMPSYAKSRFTLGYFHDSAVWLSQERLAPNIINNWKDFTTGRQTIIGSMFDMTKEYLEKHNSDKLSVILCSDGMPTDDFQESFDKLKRYCTQSNILCSALAIGEEYELPNSFVSGNGSLIKAPHNKEAIIKAINEVIQHNNDQLNIVEPAAGINLNKPLASPSPKPVNSPTVDERFLRDYQELKGNDFIAKYSGNNTLLKIGPKNKPDYRPGQAPVFAENVPTFSLAVYRPTEAFNHLTAVPNPTLRMNKKIYQQLALDHFFNAKDNIPDTHFNIYLLAPARVNRFGDQWLCSEKGIVAFSTSVGN